MFKHKILSVLILAGFASTGLHAAESQADLQKTLALQQATIQRLEKELADTKASTKIQIDEIKKLVAESSNQTASSIKQETDRAASVENAIRELANQGSAAANAARSVADSALSRTMDSVIMRTAAKHKWSECPDGYKWVGGWNSDIGVAMLENNVWHKNYSWLCIKF
ncbi:MAG: hypothetical protein EOP04_04080 [Proteobacteria bacterium]|nr:MAG: hypothetical protein EOP04_04080 [Pseudomonadota bacterium]